MGHHYFGDMKETSTFRNGTTREGGGGVRLLKITKQLHKGFTN